jgi:hypothetical protein
MAGHQQVKSHFSHTAAVELQAHLGKS